MHKTAADSASGAGTRMINTAEVLRSITKNLPFDTILSVMDISDVWHNVALESIERRTRIKQVEYDPGCVGWFRPLSGPCFDFIFNNKENSVTSHRIEQRSRYALETGNYLVRFKRKQLPIEVQQQDSLLMILILKKPWVDHVRCLVIEDVITLQQWNKVAVVLVTHMRSLRSFHSKVLCKSDNNSGYELSWLKPLSESNNQMEIIRLVYAVDYDSRLTRDCPDFDVLKFCPHLKNLQLECVYRRYATNGKQRIIPQPNKFWFQEVGCVTHSGTKVDFRYNVCYNCSECTSSPDGKYKPCERVPTYLKLFELAGGVESVFNALRLRSIRTRSSTWFPYIEKFVNESNAGDLLTLACEAHIPQMASTIRAWSANPAFENLCTLELDLIAKLAPKLKDMCPIPENTTKFSKLRKLRLNDPWLGHCSSSCGYGGRIDPIEQLYWKSLLSFFPNTEILVSNSQMGTLYYQASSLPKLKHIVSKLELPHFYTPSDLEPCWLALLTVSKALVSVTMDLGGLHRHCANQLIQLRGTESNTALDASSIALISTFVHSVKQTPGSCLRMLMFDVHLASKHSRQIIQRNLWNLANYKQPLKVLIFQSDSEFELYGSFESASEQEWNHISVYEQIPSTLNLKPFAGVDIK